MYDDLILRLRDAAKMSEALAVLLPHSEGNATAKLYNEAADAIEELQADKAALNGTVTNLLEQIKDLGKPKWISATERLPEEEGWYQVYAPNYTGGSSSGLKNIRGNMYSAFKNGKWSIEVGYHKRPGCVKAWMPLPQPPEEG